MEGQINKNYLNFIQNKSIIAQEICLYLKKSFGIQPTIDQKFIFLLSIDHGELNNSKVKEQRR
ncbi:unnamed protein product [Paramecium octaurelia]|uniref:Uncharacterized protein n=1 Tax=Paramecium octaurelia TaxID=43137 RepID=A0A8S1V425_PAROT|nr:unnamed protein product [Paramecium octaurelia]